MSLKYRLPWNNNPSSDLFLQGFLYVFGGLLDSAYTQIRCPLWLYDTGESHHVCVHVVKLILAADVSICFPAESSGLTGRTCCCTFLPAHVPPKTREKICITRTFSCVQRLSKLSSAVCLVFWVAVF